MSYSVFVSFSSPSMSHVFSLSDVITDDDWTNVNYWDDIGLLVSSLICDGDSMLSTLFPSGHDYSLSEVNVTHLEDVEE